MKKIPVYPDDFFDYSSGVDISNDHINKWIVECVNSLEKSGDNYMRASGNTLVEATMYEEGIDIIVVKKFMEYQYFNED